MQRTVRQMEFLDRGLIAVQVENGIFVSWRMLGTEGDDTFFDLYRDGVRINEQPISSSTNYLDMNGLPTSTYYVQAKSFEDEDIEVKSETVQVWNENYLTIPLQKPGDGKNPDGSTYSYRANDASVGDLDGDGEYEIILKWDPSNSKDNAHSGHTGEVFIDAYKLDGTFLWRIGLGKNIRAGAHYTQFLVYDLDGDGKAEVVFKTADGTTDGTGKVIGDLNADFRNDSGRILEGPEYLTVFEGETGKELVTVPFEPKRGNAADWGDNYGNRCDRFLAAIAYLDGERPSFIMARGYYEKTVLTAYNWRDNELSRLWTFDSTQAGNEGYAGQGNHSLSVADVDGDGKDEIIYGAMVINNDGTGLATTELGHGDALHAGKLRPNETGIDVFQVHEDANAPYGMSYRKADSPDVLWGVYSGEDTGRGMAADIDPRYEGAEVWAAGRGLYTIDGKKISDNPPPSINFGIWWDGDLLRELLDHHWDSETGIGVGKIEKWDYENGQLINILTAAGTYSNNGTKGNPCLQADLFGDWREEVIWKTEDSTSLRIYTTTDITAHRFHTLMHDPVYRLAIAWQNVAYNQPPHLSFYLGEGMEKPSKPNISIVKKKEL